MSDADKLEAPIRKEVGEAVRALDALNRGLAQVVGKLPRDIDAEKAKPAAMKVHAYVKRYAPVTKVVGSAAFDRLSPDTQAGLRWLDDTIAEMMRREAALRKAAKVQSMDFAKDPEGVVKSIRVLMKEGDPPSWMPGTLVRIEKDVKIDDDRKKRTEALVKVMAKGEEIGGIPGTAITSLALGFLLYMLWMHLKGRGGSKPKF